ncbi:MAG: hypothetical protein IKE58_12905 [Blautia sp.]|nr:hypothetical protein [Blautia sp.]
MAERMLVTQALDERDLLVKKIRDKIAKASFVDTIKHNEETVLEARLTKEQFAQKAQSAYQQIQDLITRFQKLDAAIVASNAVTYVDTSYGKMSVAAAIALRRRLRGKSIYTSEGDFDSILYNRMRSQYQERVQLTEKKNKEVSETAAQMRITIFGRDAKTKDDKPLDVVDTYVQENTTDLVDPLDVRARMEQIKEKQDTLLRELDTQIKVANATTFIEIE